MSLLRAIMPSQESGAQCSSAGAENNEGQKPENHGSHHHDCEAIRGFYKVQEGLDLGTGIARGCLLDFVEHLASYFRTLVKQSHGQ